VETKSEKRGRCIFLLTKSPITDLALAIVFPVIDLFGGRQWFLNKLRARRSLGKF